MVKILNDKLVVGLLLGWVPMGVVHCVGRFANTIQCILYRLPSLATFLGLLFRRKKMEAIDLNDDGQNDVMDEVIEISEANRGTQPKQVQSRRDESVEKTEEEKEEEDKEKEKEEESGESIDLT
ncbi:hypothetical protein DY000_02020158 [Brassica cretica]|uniref:Uncharacterized protein n=1 Tax=Brassica cretica TaxID=69181 RepID=A0ABQ7E590_BRACR|nr:hypothetical protein DY000_02020158 [Brassica cretica]